MLMFLAHAQVVPRMLRPAATTRDLRTTLFGRTYPSPLIVAPVGVQGIFHRDGEVAVAQVAADLGLVFCFSTAASVGIETLAKEHDKAMAAVGKRIQTGIAAGSGESMVGAGGGGAAASSDAKTELQSVESPAKPEWMGEPSSAGDRWFQLYWPNSKPLTNSLLRRARQAGYSVLVVTLDTFSIGYRPWDLDLGYIPFLKGLGVQVGLEDPVFQASYRQRTGGKEIHDDIDAASRMWLSDCYGRAHGWEELRDLREEWEGPIVLKGIQCAEDAARAVDAGMEGIVVSNHGGRQVDGAVGSLEVLPEIVDAVRRKEAATGKKCTVLFDSGIRTGADVIKALCLGAQCVLVGRPWVYGLGIGGKEGVREALSGLLADLDTTMGLAGLSGVRECGREWVRRSETGGGGERFSSS